MHSALVWICVTPQWPKSCMSMERSHVLHSWIRLMRDIDEGRRGVFCPHLRAQFVDIRFRNGYEHIWILSDSCFRDLFKLIYRVYGSNSYKLSWMLQDDFRANITSFARSQVECVKKCVGVLHCGGAYLFGTMCQMYFIRLWKGCF